MLKKSFFAYAQQGYDPYRYTPVDGGETINFGLENLMYWLDPEQEIFWMYVTYFDNDSRACVYLSLLIREYPKINFRTLQEEEAFEKAYDEYCEKRYEDMPKVIMSPANLEELRKKWEIVKTLKPKYLVLTLDDSGPLDVVDMYWGDELSSDDQAEMKEESKKYRRWEKAFELYKKDHPFWWYSDYWYGPDDSFFEADLEPYYNRDTPLLEKKKYTKKQIGLELKEKVKQKEYPQFLGKWFYQVRSSNLVDADDNFKRLLCRLYDMEDDPDRAPSYERLDEIANLIIAGRDDEIQI